MRYIFILFTLIFLSNTSKSQSIDIFFELDDVIANKALFEEQKRKEISSLKEDLKKEKTSDLNKYSINESLLDAYLTYNFDSAIMTGSELLKLADKIGSEELNSKARIKIAFTLLSSGIFSQAKDSINLISSKSLSTESKRDYYFTFSRLYIDMADYYQRPLYHNLYELGLQYLDSAISVSEPQSAMYLSLLGLKAIRTRDFPKAIGHYEELFKNHELNEKQFAIDASTYAYALEQTGDIDGAVYWLSQAAIKDIKIANKENTALIKLAEILYRMGEISRSSKYLNVTLDDATNYGAVQRKFQIFQILPIIENTKLEMTEKQKRKFQLFSIALTTLSLVVIVFLYILFRQYQKIKAARDLLTQSNLKLREANLIKEEYIGYFFKTNSDYIEKLEDIRVSIESKITNQKIHEIRPILNRLNSNKERDKMFETFDSVFLKIFPDFVSKFNELFNEEDRIVLKNGETLNTDLRIFALVRLGINDPEKIAQILNYTVNTIHTYKSRIKNKSLKPNENFENEIRKIQSI